MFQSHCVELCSGKNIRVNHKIMAVYMEVQPYIVQKRIEEMNKLNPVPASQEAQPATPQQEESSVPAAAAPPQE